ncbi:MAG: hypothetical protein KC482_04120 [Dehalococcoidia bacterium]|nr:hypothetical protein [Dehalococcoidia bacterium]MCA9845893.1 hypothetical protein [Dehalococcoidia bacterium]MCA9852770.1 hypothetical protein [Dehalococcoidia bacterium]
MSRRKNRKRQRNQSRRERLRDDFAHEPVVPTAFLDDVNDTFLNLARAERPAARACGSCHEFIEDQEVGRGTCLHPASGIFAPWYDTPACPYYRRN